MTIIATSKFDAGKNIVLEGSVSVSPLINGYQFAHKACVRLFL